MIKILKKPIGIITIVIFIGLIAGGYLYFGREKKPEFDVVVAKRSDLIQEVSVTGRVKPAINVDLAFEKSGKVARVNVVVGDIVPIGQTLISLNNAEIAAQVTQAEAAVESVEAQLIQYEAALAKDQAKLAELKLGTRPEEIQLQEVKIANAKTSLEDARRDLANKVRDAFTKTDDAVQNHIDQLYTNPRIDPRLDKFNIANSSLRTELENKRLVLERLLKDWGVSLATLAIDDTVLDATRHAKTNLDEIMKFLDRIAFMVNGLQEGSYLTQATIDGYKADIVTARTNVNTAVVNLSAAEEKTHSAKSTLTLAEQELALKLAGTIEEQITAQEAQIQQAKANISSQRAKIKEAEANVQYYYAQLAKTIIRSPINGIVTIQNAKVGEIISANTLIVSLISASQFEIEANMPEADVAKVKLGNTAKVTLDAYGNDVNFNVKVVAIDPAETIIDGVATYKTTFQFTDKDKRIKSGMTANIDISTEKREGVIVIPQRAVVTKSEDKIVRILNGEVPKEVKVKTGLRGSDGNIEIIEGVNEGDNVIIFFE